MRSINKAGRIAGAVGVAGVAATTALTLTPGTFGSFTASASNPGNSVQAGTVHMADNVTGALTLSGLSTPYSTTNMEPGQSVHGTVTITNSGSLPATATVAVTNTSGTVTPASDWTLKIVDDNNNVIYNNNLANFSATALPATTGSNWAAGEAHTYTVTVGLASSAANEAQSSAPSFELDWASTQA
jgi:hypothetical protein